MQKRTKLLRLLLVIMKTTATAAESKCFRNINLFQISADFDNANCFAVTSYKVQSTTGGTIVLHIYYNRLLLVLYEGM